MPTNARVQNCVRVPFGSTVQVRYSERSKTACYGGLQTCGSVWVCAVCAAKISERRRVELRQGHRTWEEQGGAVHHATYTVRHKRADDLAETVDGILAARKRIRTGKTGDLFRTRFAVAGTVRALEVTHGRHGWHPHVHELVFTRSGIDPEELQAWLRDRWSTAVQRCGLRDVNEHGVTVSVGRLTAAEYIAKFGHERAGWDVEHEVTKAITKRGRQGSRTPVDLLDAYAFGDKHAGMLWQHYAEVFKGKRQLAWSRGLRDLLQLGKEQTDEEVAADVADFEVLLAELTLTQWQRVLANDCRAELLGAAERGGREAVMGLLAALAPAGSYRPCVAV